MARATKQAIAIVLFCALIFAFLHLIPARPEICTLNDKTGHEQCAPYHLSLFIFIKIFEFLNFYSAAISALATVAVGLFTFQLKKSTDALKDSGDLQLQHLKESSERQLRAYVFMDHPTYKSVAYDTWAVSFQAKNFGQTPAHQVRVIYAAAVTDWNDGVPQIPEPNMTNNFGSIAPNNDFIEKEVQVSGKTTLEELSVTKAIYLTGQIRYRDVFLNEDRITNFRYYAGGDSDVGLGVNDLYADEDGNDAT